MPTVYLWVSYNSRNKPDNFLSNTTPAVICNGVESISVTSERIFKSLMQFTHYWINHRTLRIKKHI